jgi:23S rRNA (cytidine1920-2'-O)/16S rRNA (cytidine1409-2'-O)-methyltransferase
VGSAKRFLGTQYEPFLGPCVMRRTLSDTVSPQIAGIRCAAMARKRLDALMAERGLFESRSRAAAAVMAGDVQIAGRPARKPGELVGEDVDISIRSGPDYVSRGGVKLANALDAFGIDPAGAKCLDVGASTGGFTDVLLQRGAERVVALDVAYGQLHWRLRQDPRVTVVERVNARSLDCSLLPFRPQLIVVDVSFISLTKVLPAVLACADDRFDCLAMVKPQFEAGRDRIARGGVVRDAQTRVETVVAVAEAARDGGHAVIGFAPSGLAGPAGNRETFAWIAEAGRAGALDDVRPAAEEAGV